LAGRSQSKLKELSASLPGPGADWPLIVADAADEAALDELVLRTTAVVTTVGPYLKYGLGLVSACAKGGTHYADLTGETLFVRQIIDDYDELARSTGARIVNSCGFDSIPSDLGVLLAYEHARDRGLGHLTDTTLVVVAMKAGSVAALSIQCERRSMWSRPTPTSDGHQRQVRAEPRSFERADP
jgi:short subunit dehydrogenase-like uncharacterized protein